MDIRCKHAATDSKKVVPAYGISEAGEPCATKEG